MGLIICNMGRMDYEAALAIQEKMLNLRQQNLIRDTLLIVEHPSVLTLVVHAGNIPISLCQKR